MICLTTMDRKSAENVSISDLSSAALLLKWLNATTAGIAAAKPAAVAISASEIPGATTARLADPLIPIPLNDSIIPQTVPKSPIKGAVLPVVARKDNAFSSLLL